MNLSHDWTPWLALSHEKEKGSHSVEKEAKEFAREIDLDLETKFDWKIKSTKNLKELLKKGERRLLIPPGI